MESHRVDFTGISLNGEDCTKGIVQGISLYNDRFVRNPVGEDRSGSESGLEGIEGFLGIIREVSWGAFMGQAGKQVSGTMIPE